MFRLLLGTNWMMITYHWSRFRLIHGYSHIELVGERLHVHVCRAFSLRKFVVVVFVFTHLFRVSASSIPLTARWFRLRSFWDAPPSVWRSYFCGADKGGSNRTLASIWSASSRSSSTCLSLSRLSNAISLYSRCRRSIVFWLATRLSSACLCARSTFSHAFDSCFSMRYSFRRECGISRGRDVAFQTSCRRCNSLRSIFFSSSWSLRVASSFWELEREKTSFSIVCNCSTHPRMS